MPALCVLRTTKADLVAVSEVVVGSRSVEMLATQTLLILGSMVSRPANVSSWVIDVNEYTRLLNGGCLDGACLCSLISAYVLTAKTTAKSIDTGAIAGATMPDTAQNTITCPKCAVNNRGRTSCCFRSASWFQKCGDVGDPNFAHTWFDGIQACKRKIFSG